MKHHFTRFRLLLIPYFIAVVLSIAVSRASASTESAVEQVYAQALSAYAVGDLSSALTLAQRAFLEDEDFAPTSNLLGTIWREAGSARGLSESERYLQRAVRLAPDSVAYAVNLARTRVARGGYGSARKTLEDVLAVRPDYIPAHVLLGDVLAAEGLVRVDESRLGRALGEYLEAVKRNPREAGALVGICRLLGATGRWREAASYLPAAMAASVDDHELYLLSGAAYTRLGDYASAERAFASAFALGGPDERAVFTDPTPILSTSRVGVWRLLDPATRAESTRVFWRASDPDLTTPVSEALVLFMTRVVEANLRFSVPREALSGHESDRGEVYVRYGEPSYVTFDPPDLSLRSEGRSDETRLFVPGEDIVNTVPTPQIPGGGPSQPRGGIIDDAPGWSGSSFVLKPARFIWVYADPPCTLAFADYVDEGEFAFPFPSDDLPSGLAATAAAWRGRRPWVVDIPEVDGIPLTLEAFCFRGESEKSEVTVVGSFPFSTVAYRLSEGVPLTNVTRRFSVDDASWTTVATDSFDGAVQAFASGGDVLGLTGYKTVVEPGSLTVAASVYDPLTGRRGYAQTPLLARSYPHDSLALSDLVIATRADTAVQPGPFVWGNYVYQPVLNRQIVGLSDLHLYYELYGLGMDEARSTKYRATYRVTRLDEDGREGRRPAVSSTFSYHGISRDETGALSLDLSGLSPGEYAVELIVSDLVRNRDISAKRRFVLHP
jgi:GWxTD domain-containing protein